MASRLQMMMIWTMVFFGKGVTSLMNLVKGKAGEGVKKVPVACQDWRQQQMTQSWQILCYKG